MKRVNKLNSGRIFRSWGSIFSVCMLLFVMGSLKSQAIDSLILNKPGWVLSGNYSAAALLSNPRSSSNFSYNDSLAGASYNSNFSAEYALDLTPVVSASEGVLEISFNYSYRNTGFDSLLIEFWNADSARYVSLAEIGLSSTTSSPQSNYCSGTSSITYKLWLSNFSSNNLSNFKLRIRYNDEGVQSYGFCIKDLRIKSSTCVVAPSVNLLASKALEADFRLGLSSGSDNFFYKDSIKYELRVDTSSSFSNPRVINSTSYLNNNLNNRFFRLYHADTSSLDKSYKPTSGTGTAATGTNYGWATSSEFQSIDTFLQYFGMSSTDIGKFKNLKDKIEIAFYLRDRRSAFSSRSGHTGYYLLDSLNNTNVLDKFSGTPNYNFVVTYKSSGDSIKIEDSHFGPNNYGSVYGIVVRSLFAESDLKASGLTQSTKYYYSARLKQCVGTSSGPWSASKTFTTKCGTAPILSYTQDFESVTTVNTLNTSAFVVPKCDEVDLVSGDFRINYGSLTYSRRPALGSRKYATVGKNSDVLFKTPLIKFQANSTYKFDMKYTSDGLSGFSYTVGVYKYRNRDSILAGKGRVMLIDSVVVGARSLNGPSDVNSYLGVRKYFNFNVSDSGNYYVVLRVKGNSVPTYFTFDDINIDLAKSSTCFAPSNIVSTVAYGDSLSISYTSNSRSSTGSGMYQIDIAAPGVAAGLGSLSVVSDTFATLRGLTLLTNYRVYVRAVCGAGDTSDWSLLLINFNSGCPLYKLPYTQDFESVTTVNAGNKLAFVVPKCHEVDLGGLFRAFRINYGSNDFSRHPASGSRYATVGRNSDILFKTPLIKFQANSTYKFDMKYTSGGFLGFSYTVGVYKYRNRDSILAGKGRVVLIDSVVVGARSLNGFSDVNPYLGVRKYFNFNVSDSGNYYVVLRVKGNSVPTYFTFDDINIDLSKSSTCFAPRNIVFTGVYGDSVSISYRSNSRSSTGSGMYQIDIAAPGVVAGLGSLSVVSDTFTTLRGLTSTTNYRVYIRAICGAGDTSNWSLLPINFNSGCSLFNPLPYDYDFETNSICWSNDADAKYKSFTYQSGGTPSNNTGPSGASQGSKYIFTEATKSAATDTFLIYSPEINLDTVANKKGIDIQFDYHMYGQQTGRLLLQLERPINSGNYVTLVEFVGQQQTSSAAAWKTARYILPQDSLVDTLLKFRFLGTGMTSFASDMAVDNFRVKYVVGCNSFPRSIAVSEVTDTSAKVKWVEGFRGVSSYKVIYSRDTSVYGIEGTLYTAYDSLTINGLMPENTYKVYLTPICGTDTSKIYSYLGNISTLCNSYLNLPYSYGFETNSICWVKDANAKYKEFTYQIGGTPTGGTGPSRSSQGSKYVFTEASGVTTTDTFLIYSPKINLDTVANKKGVDIQFDYHMYGASTGRMLLQLERPINSGNYVTLVEFVGQQQSLNLSSWKTAQYILPQDSLVDTLLKFRFLGTGVTGSEGDMAVDNFRVKYFKCTFSTEIRLSRSDSTLDSRDDKDAFNLYTTNPNSYTHVWSNSTISDSVFSITSQMIKAAGGNIRNEISVEVTDVNGCKSRDTAYVYYKDKCVFSTEIRLSRSDSTLDSKNDKDAFNLYTTNPNSYRHVWSNSMTTDSVFSITSQMIKASGGSIRNEISVEVTDLNGCKARDTAYVYYKDKCAFSTEIRLSRSDSTLDSRDDKDAFNLYTTNPNSYTHVWSNSTISDSVLTITSQMIKAAGANIMNEISVEVTDLKGCKSRDTAYVYYKDKGIVNLGEVLLNLEVYPNPSKGIFSIEMNIEEGIEYVSYKVLDLTGRLVKSYAKEQGGKVIKKEIDISDKSEGVYILMIETERGVIVNRLSLIK